MIFHSLFHFAVTLEPDAKDSGNTREKVARSLSHQLEENFPTHIGL